VIQCNECLTIFKTLTGSHLNKHKLSVNEYKKKYKVKYIHSLEARIKIGFSKIGNKNTKGKTLKLKKETRKKLRINLIKLNKSPSIIELRRQQLKDNTLSLGLKHSRGSKRKISIKLKRLWRNPTWKKLALKNRQIFTKRKTT
jgi:hypothetical protein